MATFTNQATLSYNGGSTNSNIITGEIIEVLTASKTAVVNTYRTPDKITYVISLINSGTTTLTGLTLTDNLGAYTVGVTAVYPLTYIPNSIRYYTNGTLAAAPTVAAAAPLTITGISVPAGGNATIIYEAATNEFTPRGNENSVVNTATVTGAGLTNPVTATESVSPVAAPDLSITKSVNPGVVAENGQLTYTFLIENYGNTEASAADNVVITDTFNPILTGISVSYNKTAWAEPANYTYNETNGSFATVAGQITVPAATFTQDAVTGIITTTPGTAIVTVTGTI
mgnify:FL=1